MMLIKEPSVELIPYNGNTIEHVAKCARVCYGKESGDDKKLYKSLIAMGHYSMFRHETYYAIVPLDSFPKEYLHYIEDIYRCPYDIIGIDIHLVKGTYYIVYNGNFALDYPDFHDIIEHWLVRPEDFANASPLAFSMMRYTFKIVTQDSTTKELNRVSPNSIAEISTRRVLMDSICRPHWISKELADGWNNHAIKTYNLQQYDYLLQCDECFETYKHLIDSGLKKEDARGLLPKDTATEVVYTYSVQEWSHIIRLRTDRKAHPNCKLVINMVKEKLEELGYNFVE